MVVYARDEGGQEAAPSREDRTEDVGSVLQAQRAAGDQVRFEPRDNVGGEQVRQARCDRPRHRYDRARLLVASALPQERGYYTVAIA